MVGGLRRPTAALERRTGPTASGRTICGASTSSQWATVGGRRGKGERSPTKVAAGVLGTVLQGGGSSRWGSAGDEGKALTLARGGGGWLAARFRLAEGEATTRHERGAVAAA